MRQPLEGGFRAVQLAAQGETGILKIPAAFGKREQLETLREGRPDACGEGPMQATHKGSHTEMPIGFLTTLSPSNLSG